MLYYPERVALAGILTYCFLWLISPLDVVFPVSIISLIYIFLGYVAYFLGCITSKKPSSSSLKSKIKISNELRKKEFWIFVLLGGIGMSLRLYDKYMLRGVSLADSALEARDVLADVSAGPLAAAGGILYPFCYIPLIMLWMSKNQNTQNHSLTMRWVAYILFTLPALDALLLLSRSQMLIAYGMMYISASCALFKGVLLPKRLFIPVFTGLTSLLLISVVVFSSRLEELDIDIVFSILNSAYGYVLTPNDSALIILSSGQGWLASTLEKIIPVFQYYLHGVLEFGLLWDNFSGNFIFGSELFYPYVKLLSMAGIIPQASVASDIYYREGVFTSFFGPLWVDFGWFGLLFMFLLGIFSKHLSHRVKFGLSAYMPAYAFLCVVIFFMPVVNLLVSAQGMYVLNAFMIFMLLTRYHKKSTKK